MIGYITKLTSLLSNIALIVKQLLLIFILILNFQTLVKSDDIKEFEIEGISIGDSLLEYLSIQKINNLKKFYSYKNKDVYQIVITNDILELETYEFLQLDLKAKDKNYNIPLIGAVIEFPKKIEKCKIKKEEITKDIMKAFPKLIRKDDEKPHPADNSNDSMIYQSFFVLKSGDIIGIECEDWSNKLEKKLNYTDRLKVTLVSSKHNNWLIKEAHN